LVDELLHVLFEFVAVWDHLFAFMISDVWCLLN
jgi:hypothetical protein